MAEKELGRRINSELHEIYLGYVKAFLIEPKDKKELILVDTGLPGKGKDTIISYINSINHSIEDVKYIILTHAHMDHFGNAYDIQKLSGAHVGISEAGMKYVDGEAGLLYPVAHDFKNRMMVDFIKIMGRFSRPKYIKPDMVLKEGDFPESMGVNARILETPGHTADSISIFLKDSKTIIVGDLLFGGNGLKAPPFYEDYIALLNSVKKIKDANPDLVCVSHGKNYPISELKV
ncbi:MAG: MBL fold metallo-hydrolase [Candidatus Parvarchaeota archaeon]|nr:MBL fold metallo-hydrolase [Candidatus Parvarchaeota archaeon]MCW1301745.1 MBL fold metallo-hydrolase [Candidatus Parvarchaeota archaeon]